MYRRPAPQEAPGEAQRRPRRDAAEDLIIIGVVGVVVFFILTVADVFEALAVWLHTRRMVDELVALLLVVTGGAAVFAWRRWRDLVAAQRELRILSGVIPLCAWCRRVRNTEGLWVPLEDHVERQSEAAMSPEVCPECTRRIPGAHVRRGL
jgi:hypothetical protein